MFERALDLVPAERVESVRQPGAEDPARVESVLALLEHDRRAAGCLSESAAGADATGHPDPYVNDEIELLEQVPDRAG